jgi:hypothetical protein
MCRKLLAEDEVPLSTSNSRIRAKSLVRAAGSEQAIDIVAYTVRNWVAIKTSLKIVGNPSMGVILGFVESIRAMKAGKATGSGTGADRVGDDDYYENMQSGW